MRVSSTGRRPREPESYKTSLDSLNKQSEMGKFNQNKHVESSSEPVNEDDIIIKSVESAMNSVKGAPPTSQQIKETKAKKQEEVKKAKRRRKKEKTKAERTLPKLGGGRIFLMVIVGILSSAGLAGVVYGLYMNQIKYPSQMVIDDTTTGSYCLRNWEQTIKGLDQSIADFIGEDESFLQQEVKYANDDKAKLDFLYKVVNTVEYIPQQTEALNKYGNLMIDRSDEVVYTDSDVKVGEKITLQYVDYSAIKLDDDDIHELMEEEGLAIGDVDYSVKLVDVFCKYITSLKELPVTTDKKYIPNMALGKGNKYILTKDEDIYIDKLLFSSEDFFELLDNFSVIAGASGEENPEWVEWNKLSDEEKKDKEEPEATLTELQPTQEWVEWNNLDRDKQKEVTEPPKYDPKGIINKTWCGTYYLQNEYTEMDENGNTINVAVGAMKGDGTFEDPAGLNTDVITYVLSDNPEEEKQETEDPVSEESPSEQKESSEEPKESEDSKPIKIRMTEFGVSKDAIDWFESKDVRNRGIDLDSEVQYCYYVFQVTNMSDAELTIDDNSALCDVNANIHSRTGEIFGLSESVTLKPDETGIIETWGMSTSLNKQYVIWGKDFDRRENPVWFRCLMGNLEDESEDKGVYLNKTREMGVNTETTLE